MVQTTQLRQQDSEYLIAVQDQERFLEMIQLTELYLRRGYLEKLSDTQIAPLAEDLGRIEPGTNLRLIKLEAILFEKEARLSQKLQDLFGAVEACDAGMLLIVNGKRDRVEIYIGVCADSLKTVNPAFYTFLSSLSGILPGCRYRQLKTTEAKELLREVFPSLERFNECEEHAMAAVSALPRTADGNSGRQAPPENPVKLDALIDGMRGKPFSMVVLNRAIKQEELSIIQSQLETLYSQLSPYEHIQFSISENDTDSVNLNFSHAVNANESYSTGITHGVSHTRGTGKSETREQPDERGNTVHAGLNLLGTATAIAAGASDGILKSLFFASGISSALTNIGIVSGLTPKPVSGSVTNSEHEDHSVSDSKQITFSTSSGTSDSSGYSIGNNKSSGSSIQYSAKNKSVSDLLEELDRELVQVQELKRGGAFTGAAYFIAGEEETAVTAANLYRAMTQSSGGKRSPINRWSSPEQLSQLTEYLARGRHPVFLLDNAHTPTAEVAQFIGVSDTPAYFSLPEQSVPGFIVSEYAGFSRDIISQNGIESSEREADTVGIGYIWHMGRIETQTPIRLTVDDLTKHLFVTGATGVGKSNFCYQLLDQLLEREVRVLVIEPAKGEYAGVFGGRDDFAVFGADPKRAPVLRINPFAFPEGVSVVQHVERLLDIFNAAWPMYSAMPAILKEAIEKIYADRGFDSVLGTRPENAEFPCFDDLLAALPQIIKNSAYSAEVQGNYIGALVTRVKSLTNGLYGILFGRNEVGDSALFDGNTVVDISRIGSQETKALVMGVLTMRLNEYRMCSGLVNSPLRHVTLLEEAHNLLRGQIPGSPEGANVRTSSVEMITNAIAEMRTYGEGFIIADQSPSVLDPSVIRNTQTKVVFMLPDRNDREIVGNALSLSENQKQEVARLSPGVAAVYQNGWTSAVLSKIHLFAKEKFQPLTYSWSIPDSQFRTLREQCLAVILSGHFRSGSSSVSRETIQRLVEDDYSVYGSHAATAQIVLRHYLETGTGPDRRDEVAVIDQMLPLADIIRSAGTAEGAGAVRQWAAGVREKIKAYVTLTEDEIYALVSCGIHNYYPGNQGKRQNFRILYLTYCRPDDREEHI